MPGEIEIDHESILPILHLFKDRIIFVSKAKICPVKIVDIMITEVQGGNFITFFIDGEF